MDYSPGFDHYFRPVGVQRDGRWHQLDATE